MISIGISSSIVDDVLADSEVASVSAVLLEVSSVVLSTLLLAGPASAIAELLAAEPFALSASEELPHPTSKPAGVEFYSKSESMPKYHARETAIELAKLVPGGASVVLGSATPSLESYYRATTGQYHLFELKRRLTGGTLPQVEIADLREELRTGNRSIFSRRLQELMEDRLNKGEQAMLFINRRGLAGFVSCRSCGYVFKCPHCDVSLSEHRGGRLVCHYCGYEQPLTKICPKCSSKYVSSFRAGTQQIEDEVKKMWPNARTLRMDADTTRTKGSYDRILSAFASKEADVLVGTQMIVKGHDFPDGVEFYSQ